jgi:hypothetical protein
MKIMRTGWTLVLTLGFGFGLVAWQAEADVGDVLTLDEKDGICPCFDHVDLNELIENAANPVCTYNYNVDRRLRIFDTETPADQAFTRAGVACYGAKVRAGNAPGLPGVGSFAMYDSEGKSCRKTLIKAARRHQLDCGCINQDGENVACPDSL